MERMAWAPGARLRNKQFLDALDLCYHVAKQEPREITIQELRAYVKGIVRGQREALLVSEQLPPENVISLYTKRCARQLKAIDRIVAILRSEFTCRIDERGEVSQVIDDVVNLLARHMYQLELTRRIVKEVVAAEDSLIMRLPRQTLAATSPDWVSSV